VARVAICLAVGSAVRQDKAALEAIARMLTLTFAIAFTFPAPFLIVLTVACLRVSYRLDFLPVVFTLFY
jgi:hypothetical protein